MRYVSENHDVVVKTSGGCQALERMGFKPERVIRIPVVKPGTTPRPRGGETRAQLIKKAKEKGVEGYSVYKMTKPELIEVAGDISKARIKEIQDEAIARWKKLQGK